ncbi:hypothetical protein [Egicoccus sp. AB-alg6-2]|uniref:hypothetical protein n=1 Tax=Egicoccus sp. AB-alg6-2 TaxID=3242692 RepID=UPI00359DA950
MTVLAADTAAGAPMVPAKTSFAHAGLLLSLLVPDDWDVEQLGPNQIRFYARPVAELDDYRPTMGFVAGEPDGTGPSWFEDFVASSRTRLAEAAGFELLGTRRWTNSSLAEVAVTTYASTPRPGLAFTQLQALIAADADRLYVVNAATRRERAAQDLPVFEDVLQDLRVLPPR